MAATYTVERSVVIAAPPAQVLEEVVDLHRWQGWSPWEGLDPDLQRTYTGPARGPGASYAWTGNRKAGRGRMTITEATSSLVRVDVTFEKPFPSRSDSVFTAVPDERGSRVTWSMSGEKSTAMRLLPFLSMDRLIGGDFEKGLRGLQRVVESGPA